MDWHFFHRGNCRTTARNGRIHPLRIEALEPRCLLTANPQITEFMADNNTFLKDYYNNYSDWLEIYNPDTSPLALGQNGGWTLKKDNTTWTFPSSATVGAKGYLRVYCSGRNTVAPNGEMHTNFKLGAGGDYLALISPSGTVVAEYAPEYPQQYADISYGLANEPTAASLISGNSSGKWLVPASGSDLTDSSGKGWNDLAFTDSAWTSGTVPLGFDVAPATGSNASGFSILETHGSGLTTVQTAADLINSALGTTTTYAAAAVNYADPDNPATGRFGDDLPFGGNTAHDDDNFALRILGTLRIPTAGAWTFGVNSSDGFKLTISGATFNAVYGCTNPTGTSAVQYDGTRAAADSLGVINSLTAGNYEFELVYFDAAGPAGLEFFAASGAKGAFDSSFKLVGDTANGGLALLRVSDVAGAGNPAFATDAYTHNATALLRVPFTVASPADVLGLTLRMKYDDGFLAYLNGTLITSANAPDAAAWDSAARDAFDRLTGDAVRYEDFDVWEYRGLLMAGTNVLAIQILNSAASDSNLLAMPELSAVTASQSAAQRYFVTPTPGAKNGTGSSDLGPIVTEVSRPAARPGDAEAIVVTARVRASVNPVQTSSVTLHYRVMYNTEQTVVMVDDGAHADGAAVDGIYGAAIPASASTPGQMVRWYVTGNDTLGRSGRWPVLVPLVGSDGGPEYEGTVIASTVTSPLPIFEWFTNNTSGADGSGARGSVYYLGEFYDNVFIRHRGNATTSGNKFEFNSGYDFLFAADQARVKEINLNGSGYDSSYARPELAFGAVRDAGAPASIAFSMRVQRNNATQGIRNFIEQVDNRLLEREGLYEDGALYKLIGGGPPWAPQMNDISAGWEKKNRDDQGWSDLHAFFNDIHQTGIAKTRYLYDNVNIPLMLDYMAGQVIHNDNDWCHKNYYLYCDTNDGANATYGYSNANGTNEWTMIPWDKDWTFGIPKSYNLVDPQAHPFHGDSDHPMSEANSLWNYLVDALLDVPEIKQMYLRRLRTVMDELLQAPGTPYSQRYFEQKMDRILTQLNGDGSAGDLTSYFNDIKTKYLDPRRVHLYVDHSVNSDYPDYAGIPAVQADNLTLQFGVYEVHPASSNQDEEYLTLVNPNSVAIDLSGWRLTGGIDLTFKKGVVIPAGGTLYVSPNVWAFRHRAVGPSGNQGLLVQGNYHGHLSARGETIQLLDLKNNVAATLTTPSLPSLAQQFLRVTEVMYHPEDPATGPHHSDDFEYVELKNTSGAQTLSLTGVRFTDGISFSFTGSNVTSLAPGEVVLVVANPAAFRLRYGTEPSVRIAGSFGTFSGDLYPSRFDNAGEKITLADAVGETILSFTYGDDWYTQTDGAGNSLVVRDAAAADSGVWDRAEGWAASRQPGGSPGADEAAPEHAAGAIVVNEVLAHSDADLRGDWVEFHNTTASDIDIGGWYLSNDGKDLKKYQIAPGTIIPAGGVKALNYRDHFGIAGNPGVIVPFVFGEMGDSVYLTSAAGDALTGFQTSETFGPSDTDVTLGRYLKSTGGKDFVAMASATYEQPNSLPLVGPVVINEVHYHPTSGRDSYIELKNLTAQEVKLYDTARPQNAWQLAEGVAFSLPAGAAIPASGYALIVNISPARFRTLYSVPAAVPIYGPYSHELSNGGDTVELKRPGAPQPDGRVPFYRVDQVTYEDGGPWPKTADGFGASLNRLTAGNYGNDAANWTAGHPTPGIANVPYDSTVPTAPASLTATVISSTQINFSWTAATDAESGVAYYRVYADGKVRAVSTSTSFSDTLVGPSITYAEVAAVNGDGVEGPHRSLASLIRYVALDSATATSATTVKVNFSERLNRDTAQVLSHYQVTYGGGQQVAITEALVLPDRDSVQLTLAAPLAAGTTYTAVASGTITASGFVMTAARAAKTFSYTAPAAAPVYALREYWTGIGGYNVIQNLIYAARYPDSPNGYSDVSGGLQGPTNWADKYGTRIRTYVTAPTTGTYTFTLHADDAGELWLSTSQAPANKSRIATGNGATASVYLTSGARYYVELLQYDGGGGDGISLGWKLPSGTTEDPIPLSRLTAYVPTPENMVSIAATDASAGEAGPDMGTFTITRTGSTASALNVYYSVTGTAATADLQEDLSGTATIPAGASSVTVDITPVNDGLAESDETVRLTLLADKKYGIGGTGNAMVTVADTAGEVRARHVFYNNSAFDGRNVAANALDDGAIASDKSALLPGQAAAFENYTSYSRGINGIIVDLANAGTGFTASDFEFHVGNDHAPGSWPLLITSPAPTVAFRTLAGDITRVTILLPDNAVENQWLQVKVLATAHTRLPVPDVFYFGNAIGETGNHPSGPNANSEVDASDEAAVRSHHTATPAPLNDVYDFNRDRRVNATDELLARANWRSGLDALQWINLAGAAAAADLAALAATELAGGEGAGDAKAAVPSSEPRALSAPVAGPLAKTAMSVTPLLPASPRYVAPRQFAAPRIVMQDRLAGLFAERAHLLLTAGRLSARRPAAAAVDLVFRQATAALS